MFQLIGLLKRMKKQLKQLNKYRFKDRRNQLDVSREKLEATPKGADKEKEERDHYLDILCSLISLIKRQSKLGWLHSGDHYTNIRNSQIISTPLRTPQVPGWMVLLMWQSKKQDVVIKNLSYARGTLLIHSILLDKDLHLATISHLLIYSNMNFLWSADSQYERVRYVVLIDVCLPKANSGIWLKHQDSWNKPCVPKLVLVVVRPAFLSYMLIKYYACWVEKFYFNTRKPTTAISSK
ncbi:LOW QUALITY PROTEIN: hypothetical protein Cgig2_002374 [Carnegiea gigantea]|uniref:Uncharacterized protein n=1 Tax=Carnegiea gigantea TaxID=171969 RepID=A0A9Q1GKA7_9CARY|nr:LOW QUALITY PROTEIN: hypothetical protein Cgig2_002374 [Carnegiea gigantea]